MATNDITLRDLADISSFCKSHGKDMWAERLNRHIASQKKLGAK